MTGDLTGQVVKSYELKELIGQGGFGAVYRAHQKFIGREVAIKIILPQYANRPEFIRRFETEAQLIARLEHPHIVPLYDYWREPNGAYLVMRWLRGGSVQDSLKKNGPWQPRAVGQLLNQIGEALVVAHRQGIIHRDLKPENIMLDENGNAYLTDFGIAKELGGNVHITQSNTIVGSPAYLSPEQIKGHEVTPRSDVYAMGLVLYEMLTGNRAFTDMTPATLMYKQLSEPVPDLSSVRSDLPAAINAVIQRATAKDPELRYEDMIELARDFRRAVKSEEDSSIPIGTGVITSASGIVMPEPENPYKGLRAFQQADAADFFGREALVKRIIERLKESSAESRFLAVVGPSGSGKSSVVKAGLLPALRNGALPGSSRWFIVEMVPGIEPLEELEAALLRIAVNPPESLLVQLRQDMRGLVRALKRVLPDDDTELVLVIDQFEEMFTLIDDERVRAHFIDSLITAVSEPRSRIRVIITLRADFYDRPLNYVRFGELIRKRTEIVLPLSPEELERAITGPASRVGIQLEQGLVTAIVADVAEQPGALPLLQYALTELFERRSGFTLTMQAYHEIGGTMGALARRADELYDGLGEEGEEAARQLFLRLVTLGEGTEDTRRRVHQSELLSIDAKPDAMTMVIDAFGRYRLLTFDHDPLTRSATIEVAHEALIRQWKRLREWLDDSRDDLRTQRKLTAAAEDWVESQKDPSFLATGSRLDQFEIWKRSTDLALNEHEAEYLKVSVNAREAQLAEERARQQREAELEIRSRNRLRALVAVMAVAAVVAALLAVAAVSQSQEAQDARAEAERNAEIAELNAAETRGLALAANARSALIEHNPTLALALALKANEAFQPVPVEVMRILSSAIYGPGVRYRFEGHEAAVTSVSFSPDGRLAASGSLDGTIRLWNNRSGEAIKTISTVDALITRVDFSPDGTVLAASASDSNIYLIDPESGEEIRRFAGHTDIVTSVAFSDDGQYIVSSSLDKTARLWEVATGAIAQTFIGHNGIVLDVMISQDNRFVATSSGDETIRNIPDDEIDRTVRLWDANTGEEIWRFTPPSGFIRTVDISPDGRFVLSASWNSALGGTLSLWDIERGIEVRRLFGHNDVIPDAIFSPDGTKIISISWDKTLRIWDVETGVELTRFEVFEERTQDVDVSADGQYVLVSSGYFGGNEIERERDQSTDTSIWLIDLQNRSLIREYSGHEDWIWSTDISPNGRYAVSGSGPLRPPGVDTTVRLWNIETGEEMRRYQGHTGTVEGLAFSPGGSMIASGAWDGLVILWHFEGEEIRRFEGHESAVKSVVFSPDQTMLASGASDGTIILWDINTGEEMRRLVGHGADVSGLAFSPDGTKLASAGWDNALRLWDVTSGETIRVFEGHSNRVNDVAFSPDGKTILSGSWDTTLRLWDVDTGKAIRTFVGHIGPVQGVAISPDGKLALSGSGDTTVRLWDIETGQELFRYEGHGDWVSEVVFTPDGYALSSAQDNTLRLWQIARSPQQVIEWAQQNRYVRELSCAELGRYRIESTCENGG